METGFREKNGRYRRVLIVDDEYINREILGSYLGSLYDVVYAQNGREALEVLQDQESVFSLILQIGRASCRERV